MIQNLSEQDDEQDDDDEDSRDGPDRVGVHHGTFGGLGTVQTVPAVTRAAPTTMIQSIAFIPSMSGRPCSVATSAPDEREDEGRQGLVGLGVHR